MEREAAASQRTHHLLSRHGDRFEQFSFRHQSSLIEFDSAVIFRVPLVNVRRFQFPSARVRRAFSGKFAAAHSPLQQRKFSLPAPQSPNSSALCGDKK